jgi:hypothetical protein
MDAKHLLNWFLALVFALTVLGLRIWVRRQPRYQALKERTRTKEAESLGDYLAMILFVFF